jgi:hypothetical protein
MRSGSAHCPSQRPWVREKKDEGQQAVENNDDENQAEGGFEDFVDAPGAVAKHGEADDHGDGGGDQLGENGHGERGARAGHSEARLDDLLEGVDVVLKIARQEFANLLVEAVDVGDQRQQAEEERRERCRRRSSEFFPLPFCGRNRALVQSVPGGRPQFARSCFSRRCHRPLSHS